MTIRILSLTAVEGPQVRLALPATQGPQVLPELQGQVLPELQGQVLLEPRARAERALVQAAP